ESSASGMELAQRQQYSGQFSLLTLERADDHRIDVRALDRFEQRERQNRMRAHFDEEAMTLGQHLRARLREADGVSKVAVPVLGIELGAIQSVPRHRRVQRKRAGPRVDGRELAQYLVSDSLHMDRVRCVVDLTPASEHRRRRQLRDEPSDGIGIPRYESGT